MATITTGSHGGIANAPPGNAVISQGTSATPTFGKIGLSSHVSGNLPPTNLDGGLNASSATFWRGDGQWAPAGSVPTFSTVNNYGTDYQIVDPTLGDRPGDPNGNTYCAAIRLNVSNDNAINLIPGFTSVWALDIPYTYTFGDNVLQGTGPQANAVAKTSAQIINIQGNYYGAGQKFCTAVTLNMYGMGDSFLAGEFLQYSSGPGAGDEGIGYCSVSHVQQAQSLAQAHVTSVTRTTFNTTLTQAVTGNKNPQTVTVASTVGANIGDWIVVNQSVDNGADVIEACQITAVGVGTITAAIRFNYPSGTTLTPALVLGVDNSGGFGQQRVIVDLSGATYSAGQISSSSGGALTGSGTAWSNAMVGGSALNIGAITLAKDNYTGNPYSVGTPIKSYYQITAVNSTTNLSIHSFSIAGALDYRGAGSFPSNYVIYPAARILQFIVGQMICETSTHTWTIGDLVECAISPYPDVSGFQQRVGGYTPGGTYRSFVDWENDGGRQFLTGILLKGTDGVGFGPGRTDGGDRYAWGTGIQMRDAQTGFAMIGSPNPVTPAVSSSTDPVAIALTQNFATALSMANAGSISPNYTMTGINFFIAGGGTTPQFSWGVGTSSIVGLLLSTGGTPPVSVPDAAIDIDIQIGSYSGMIMRSNFGHSVDYMTFRDQGNAINLAGLDSNAIYYAHAVRHTPGTFANIVSGGASEGTLAAITDSTTTTWGAAITGGGNNHVLGYYNGTNWTVAAS